MADISQLSNDDLLAMAKQQQLSEIPTEHLQAAASPDPATAADRVQAGEGGIIKGAAYLAGGIPDTVINAFNLGKAGLGYGYSKLTGNPVPPALEVNGEVSPVGHWLTDQLDKSPITTTQPTRPDDTASRYLSTAGSAVVGGPRAILPALAGQYVAEAHPFQNEDANRTASILTQALGTTALGRTRGAPVPGNDVRNASVLNAQKEGFVFPPATTNPTAKNRAIETVAGKAAVQQHAAVMNQSRTNQAARTDLGLPGQGGISPAEIAQVRSEAAPAYQALRNAGTVGVQSPEFKAATSGAMRTLTGAGNVSSALGKSDLGGIVTDILSKPSHDAGDLVDTVSALRDKAEAAKRAGDNGTAAAYRGVGKAIEDQIERHLSTAPGGNPGVVADFRQARTRLAIAHTVEEATKEGSGDVNAQKLAAALNGGAPIGGQLGIAARAADVAPRAFAPPNHSAGVNHLGLWGTILSGLAVGHEGGSMLGHGGLGAAVGAVPGALALGRTGARRYALGRGQDNAIAYQKQLDPRVLAAALASGSARQ